jgi:hypothetical protein
MENFTKEFNEIDKIKMFELKVFDLRARQEDYILFNIGIFGETFRAERIALNKQEEQSKFVAFDYIEIDKDFSVTENLEHLYMECVNSIIDSNFYDLN